MHHIFIPHLSPINASVTKIINWIRAEQIGIVENVYLTGPLPHVLGDVYYEADVYFSCLYSNCKGRHIRYIAGNEGYYKLEYARNKYIILMRPPYTRSTTILLYNKVRKLENRMSVLETRPFTRVTGDMLLTQKHRWNKHACNKHLDTSYNYQPQTT